MDSDLILIASAERRTVADELVVVSVFRDTQASYLKFVVEQRVNDEVVYAHRTPNATKAIKLATIHFKFVTGGECIHRLLNHVAAERAAASMEAGQ